MFDTKKLSEDQITQIRQWAADGAQLADLQRHLEEEMKIRLSYMDTRFLVLDLGIEIRNLVQEEQDAQLAAAEGDEDSGQATVAGELSEEELEVLPPGGQGSGKVRVSVDEIARPGLMASGRVTFADGQAGVWYIDQMGRLGIDPDTEGYRPGEADIMAFQRELQAVMEAR